MTVARTLSALILAITLGCRNERAEEKPVSDPPPPPEQKDPREPMRDGVEGGGQSGSSSTAPGQSGSVTGMVVDAGATDAVAAEVPAAK